MRERRVRDRPAVVQAPTSWSSGTNTSSRNTSLNSASPVICTSGRTSMPGRRHVDDEVGDALVLGHVGVGAGQADAPARELRVRRPHLLAREQPAVVDAHARVFSDARSEPASGSEKSWHQISSAVRIDGSQRAFCSSVPCASSVGPARLMPTRLIGCSARARVLHVEDRDLDRRRAPSAVRRRASGCRPSGSRRAAPASAGRTRPRPRCSRTRGGTSTFSGEPRAHVEREG